uniref:Uncharacterized protein n=1 Tax=Myripristis murdjan TaxID=586833 RepID=A0A668A060_9TELE
MRCGSGWGGSTPEGLFIKNPKQTCVAVQPYFQLKEGLFAVPDPLHSFWRGAVPVQRSFSLQGEPGESNWRICDTHIGGTTTTVYIKRTEQYSSTKDPYF